MADLQARDLARAELMQLPGRADQAVTDLDGMQLDHLEQRAADLALMFKGDPEIQRLAARARKGLACRRRLYTSLARQVCRPRVATH